MITLRTPEPDLDRAFERAVERAETLFGRNDVPQADRVRLASSLLGAGVRAPARELLRAAPVEGLARRYRAWVGEPPGSPGPLDELPAESSSLGAAAAVFAKAPDEPGAVAGVLDAVVRDLWGIVPDAPAGAVTLRPRRPGHWPFMALARVRVGRSVLDLELRGRRDAVVARVRRASGPPLVVTLELHPAPVGPTFVDDVELHGPRVRFQAVERHEIVAHGVSA